MKKFVTFLPILILLLTPSIALAEPSKNPVFATIEQVQQIIHSGITDLQNQLNAIDQRVITLESPEQSHKYVLVDTSNQELGTLVDGFGIGEYKTVYNEQYKRFITFHPSSGQVSPNSNLFYTSNGCTGDAYVKGPWLNDYIFRVGNSTNKLALVDTNIPPASVSFHSYSNGDGCALVTENIGNAYKANLIQPYTQSVNPLFHIKVQ